MRLEISYHGGTTHEVEVPGSVCVLGRDPGCDVVLNDAKCSRRHAVLEDGPGGLFVRDQGSANGVYVNGRRVEEARLRPGDTLRLGEVQLKLLAEIGETVVVAPDDLELRTRPGSPRPAEIDLPLRAGEPPGGGGPAFPPPPREPAARRGAAPARRSPARPATVGVLCVLWLLFAPVSMAAIAFAASRLGGGAVVWSAAAVASLASAGLAVAMALGLRALAPWARHLQIALAAVGLLACPFTPASATVLLYMTRPEPKAAFEGRAAPGPAATGAEATFALSLVGMFVLGLLLTAVLVAL
jgi:hypothetical protein